MALSDSGDVHGALVCLTELATAYEQASSTPFADARRQEVRDDGAMELSWTTSELCADILASGQGPAAHSAISSQ